MTIEFVDQPPEDRRRIDWSVVLKPLTENPGKWARVMSGLSRASAGAKAQMIRQARTAWLRQWEWEAVSRSEEGGTSVFARCVGPAA